MVKRAAKQGRGGRWLGGYIRHEKDGTAVFIIEKEINRRRFHISTHCHDEKSAIAQFTRFEANPLGYSPAGEAPRNAVVMTAELIGEFHEWHLAKNNGQYARAVARSLGQWMKALGTRNLRSIELSDLKAALTKWKVNNKRNVIAIKVFFAWLRQEKGAVKHAEDPTLDLKVPQSDPAKHKRRRATDFALIEEVYPYLHPRMQDTIQALAATGWHISELRRFIADKTTKIEEPGVEVLDANGNRVVAVLVAWHKSKKWTRTSIVHQKHLDAIRRLKEHGSIPRKHNLAIATAMKHADARRREFDPAWLDREPFVLGTMRHSVATWSIDLGATVEQAAAHLDHADKRTTERFYVDQLVPKPPIPTRVLQ